MRPLIATVKKSKETKGSNLGRSSHGKSRTKPRAFIFSNLPYGEVALLEQWVKDEIIQLPDIESLPTARDLKDIKYRPYHPRKIVPFNNFTLYGEFSTVNIRPEISSSKMGTHASTSCPFPSMMIEEGAGDNGFLS